MATTSTSTAVDELLTAITDGAGVTVGDLYTADAVLDATVPGWRFEERGNRAIGERYAEWFCRPSRFDELERRPTPDGEVVTYVVTWIEHGVPHAAHHCHILVIGDEGRIARDTVFCGGRWDAARLARMQEAQNA